MSPKRPQHHGFTFSAFISIVHVSWTFNLLRSSSNSSNSRRSADLSYSTESWCNGEREILSWVLSSSCFTCGSQRKLITRLPACPATIYTIHQSQANLILAKVTILLKHDSSCGRFRSSRSSCCLDRHSRARLCLTQQERWCVYSQHPPQVVSGIETQPVADKIG
ncbi:hypothetical protein BJ322DRAFT_658484 [Thelephora terrestris]|uniref:Uncharacterized protein n=1 Tax=Thelephora terrestris TaxID=56493 RepID=A0A9P6HLS9_9AGAM|nr:hypothetical protein BJ322DRAFT_658484 [Thelephora terrestris]